MMYETTGAAAPLRADRPLRPPPGLRGAAAQSLLVILWYNILLYKRLLYKTTKQNTTSKTTISTI